MLARPYAFHAACLLAVMAICGCSRRPSQGANVLNSANQTTASAADSTKPADPNARPPENTAAPVPFAGQTPANTSSASDPGDNSAQNTPAAPEPVRIPAGTSVTIRLQQGLSSASAVPGERFEAVIDEPIVVQNQTAVPSGTIVLGRVVEARHSGRLHHPGELGLTLDTIVIGQQNVPIYTSDVVARGRSHKKRNWAWIGGGAGGGALIGALAAGGEGALIGSGIGAAAGTTTALFTGKKDVVFGAERRLRFRLHRDLSLPG